MRIRYRIPYLAMRRSPVLRALFSLSTIVVALQPQHSTWTAELVRRAVPGEKPHLERPSDVTIYVISGDGRPQGDCAAKSWVSDAVDFGYQVVYYGRNATHYTRGGLAIPARKVDDFGALDGIRDRYDVWPPFAANILEDLLQFAPKAQLLMRMDDDSFLHPGNLWRSLRGLPLHERSDWMIGDCGEDEHHATWCGGGAGIVMSRSLAQRLVVELRAGYNSRQVCALTGHNDDDTMGLCADALNARITNHHGFHWWPPVRLDRLEHDVAWWTWWPRLTRLLGIGATLDACPAERLGSFVVVQDWVTYHHLNCEELTLLSETLRKSTSSTDLEDTTPLCASTLGGRHRGDRQRSDRRCEAASENSRQLLCGF